MQTFRDALADLINSCSLENGSNTPDFILAQYLESCLGAFDSAVKLRADWHDNNQPPTTHTRP